MGQSLSGRQFGATAIPADHSLRNIRIFPLAIQKHQGFNEDVVASKKPVKNSF